MNTPKKKETSNKDVEQQSKSSESALAEDSVNEEIIPEELLNAIPVEERGKVVSIIKQSMFSSVMQKSNPIADKITEGHIDKLIDSSTIDSEREHKDKNYQRLFVVVIIILGLAMIIFLTVYLAKENEDIFMKILVPIIAFLGGIGAGFGIAKKS